MVAKKHAVFDLDAYERPDSPVPFTVTLGGRDYTMADPKDLDYRVILDGYQKQMQGDPEPMIEAVIPEGDREDFFANDLPGWRLQKLFEMYNEHYGLAVGEVSASPAS